DSAVKVVVVCHTRELAYQIKHEFDRFAKYFKDLKTGVVYGGTPISKDRAMLKDGRVPPRPHRHAGAPPRPAEGKGDLKLDKLTQFVLDECDKCLEKLDMRKDDIQQIFVETPKKKQVMMFSATMTTETRGLCKKFMTLTRFALTRSPSSLFTEGMAPAVLRQARRERKESQAK
ncbi:unnamed protein product, partial [Prorocentrum cordatum]